MTEVKIKEKKSIKHTNNINYKWKTLCVCVLSLFSHLQLHNICHLLLGANVDVYLYL